MSKKGLNVFRKKLRKGLSILLVFGLMFSLSTAFASHDETSTYTVTEHDHLPEHDYLPESDYMPVYDHLPEAKYLQDSVQSETVPYLSFVGAWDTIAPDVVARIETTFAAVWQDVVTFFGTGVRFPVNIVLGNTTVVLPGEVGNPTPGYGRVGVTVAQISGANAFNTDIIIPSLVQLAQGGTYPTPGGVGTFPTWITNGLRVFGRVHFGQYIEQGNWIPAAATVNPLVDASGAQLLMFISAHFGEAGVNAIRDMAQHARLGTYPLRHGGNNMTTWVCDDLRTGFFHSRIGVSLEGAWRLFREADGPPAHATGHMTITEALGGHTLVHGHVFHRGPTTGFPAGEPPQFLFTDNQAQKFVSTNPNAGHFWVEWRYPEPFVASRFIWQNANDNHGNPGQDYRRMNTGWYLRATNNPNLPTAEWTLLHLGQRNETGPYNFRFFAADLVDNTTAYQYYRLWSPPAALGNVMQLASVRLASETWQCAHVFAPVIIPATCGQQGFTSDVCTICSHEAVDSRRNFTPIDPTARHTGSGNFFEGNFKQAPRNGFDAGWGVWCWINPDNPDHRQIPGPGLEAMGFNPDYWWWEECTTCSKFVPVSEIYHTFLDPVPMPANRLPWSTVLTWTDIYERDGVGPAALMDRFVHSFNVLWVPISYFMFDETITNPAHLPGTINPVTYVLDAGVNAIAWASGLQSGIGQRWLRAQPWDTDAMTHELIHNAQLYGGTVPLHIHENMTDMMREWIGLFNEQADWRNPPILFYEPGSPNYLYGWTLSYRIGAAFWFWIDRQFIDVVRERTGNPYFYHFAQAMNSSVKEEGFYFPDHRQYYWLTGYTKHELWAQFMIYEHARYEEFTTGWVPGYYTLTEAVGDRTLRLDPIFVHGPVPGVFTAGNADFSNPQNAGFGSWHNRQAYNLFDRRIGPQGAATGFNPDGGQRGRYTVSGWSAEVLPAGGNGTSFQVVTTTDDFWVEWSYDEAFVADSFIFATHDNLSLPRRMGDGWTISGSVNGTVWHVLYTGSADDYSNFNNRFFRVDFPENTRAFAHYRLEAPRGPDSVAIQLSVIYLTGRDAVAPTQFDGSNPNALRALLETDDVVLKTQGNLGIFTHHSPFMIPAGRTLYVATTLNIQANAEIVIEGRVVVLEGGRINNQGGLGGTITIAAGGALINNGHVENVTNSTVNNLGIIINNARFEVRAGVTFFECCDSIAEKNLNIHRNAIRRTCCEEHNWVEHVVLPTAGTHVTRVRPISCPHNTGVNEWSPGIHPNPSWNPNLPPAGRANALENFKALTNLARPIPTSGETDPLNPLNIGGGGGHYLSCPQFCPLGADCPDLFPEFTGGGTRGFTTMKCTECDTCWGMYTYGYSPFDWGFSHNTYWRGGTGVDNVPYNPFRFTFRHHCDFGAVWTQPTVEQTPYATWENRERFGTTTFRYEYCMDGEGCGKHIDEASPADLFLHFRMPGPGRDRGQPVGTVGGSSANNVGNWALVPDEVIDRFIYAFNIVFEPIFEWKSAPLSPQWYELDMRDSIAWWSNYTNGVALSWLNRGPQYHAIVSNTADGNRFITSSDPGWRSTHHWDMDAQTHELVHAGQRYGGASLVPGGGSGVVIWIHENFTDLLRPYMGIFNREAGFTIPDFGLPGQNFEQTYRVGAAFFRWVERHSEYWTNPDSRRAGTFPEGYVSSFNRDLHNVIRANTAAGPTGRGGSFIQGTGTGADRTPQIVALTGFSINELWAQYIEWSSEKAADLQNYWRLGYGSLQEAANARAWFRGTPVDSEGNPTPHEPMRGGRPNTTGAIVNSRVNMNPIFVDGGFGFGAVTAANPRGNEGSTRLFDYIGVGGGVAGTATKYCANMDTHGTFWAIWRYAEPFVATRLIFATSNDSGTMAPGRRLGNGWTLFGGDSPDGPWMPIYSGLTNDYSNYNRMFFVFDLLGNTTAYQYYKLYCNTQGFCDWRGNAETRTRQLSVVALAYAVDPE